MATKEALDACQDWVPALAPLFETGLKPLRDQVLLKRPIPDDEKTPAGIIILGRFKQKSIEAWVIDTGPGKVSEKTGKRIPMNVKAGDRVLVDAMCGHDIGIKGRDLMLTYDHNIIAIVKDA